MIIYRSSLIGSSRSRRQPARTASPYLYRPVYDPHAETSVAKSYTTPTITTPSSNVANRCKDADAIVPSSIWIQNVTRFGRMQKQLNDLPLKSVGFRRELVKVGKMELRRRSGFVPEESGMMAA